MQPLQIFSLTMRASKSCEPPNIRDRQEAEDRQKDLIATGSKHRKQQLFWKGRSTIYA